MCSKKLQESCEFRIVKQKLWLNFWQGVLLMCVIGAVGWFGARLLLDFGILADDRSLLCLRGILLSILALCGAFLVFSTWSALCAKVAIVISAEGIVVRLGNPESEERMLGWREISEVFCQHGVLLLKTSCMDGRKRPDVNLNIKCFDGKALITAIEKRRSASGG